MIQLFNWLPLDPVICRCGHQWVKLAANCQLPHATGASGASWATEASGAGKTARWGTVNHVERRAQIG